MFRPDIFDLLVQLLSRRVPLARALAVAGDDLRGAEVATFLEELRSSVDGGGDLAPVFGNHRLLFPPPIPAFIATGEKNGTLLEALQLTLDGVRSEQLPRPGDHDVISGVRRFAFGAGVMLRLGAPVSEALEALVEAEPNGRLRQTLVEMRDAFAKGGTLADTMRENDYAFTASATELVHSAENAGQLDDAFLCIASGMTRRLFLPRG